MAVATSTLLGRPLWYELMTTDMKRPKRSTGTLWAGPRRRSKGAGQPYTMFNRGKAKDASVGDGCRRAEDRGRCGEEETASALAASGVLDSHGRFTGLGVACEVGQRELRPAVEAPEDVHPE